MWKLPVKTFWLMHKNVDRLMAEDTLRQVSALAYSQSGDGFDKFVSSLRKQMGTIAEFDEARLAIEEAVFEAEAYAELKDLGRIF